MSCLGGGRGPGGCPPGITQPTVVPSAGTGAWQHAWQPGSHDERLGGGSGKPRESIDGHRLQQLPWQGREPGWKQASGGPCWGTAGPIPFLAALGFCPPFSSPLPPKQSTSPRHPSDHFKDQLDHGSSVSQVPQARDHSHEPARTVPAHLAHMTLCHSPLGPPLHRAGPLSTPGAQRVVPGSRWTSPWLPTAHPRPRGAFWDPHNVLLGFSPLRSLPPGTPHGGLVVCLSGSP